MDPVSLAGLGLGVVSLALQLFSGCIKGYQLFLDAAGMPEKFEHLRVRMRLEQMRFLNWGERVGLLEEALEEPSITLQLHRNLIFDILVEIQRLFTSYLKIETKFGGSMTTSSGDRQSLAIENVSKVGSRNIDAIFAKASKVFEKSMEAPKRIQWAMVKQEKFENLIEQLIRYNDSMVSLLDRLHMQQVHEMQMRSHLVMLQLSDKVDDLRQLTLAMQVKTGEGLYDLTQPQQSPSVVLSRRIVAQSTNNADSLARLAAFKADRLLAESNNSSEDVELIDRRDISIAESGEMRDRGIYKGDSIWIEWKDYDQHGQIPAWSQTIESRVKRLASLLGMQSKPHEFRTPECLGCFHDLSEDGARYGLVYKMPQTQSADTTIQSLLDHLRSVKKASLTERVKLATAFASSLMFLHSVNWLHKGIRSDSVLFFSHDDQPVNYGEPIISGFEYARPDLPNEMTEKPQENVEHDIYRHPYAVTRPHARSQKSWDIYSLGIVLIEIAFWQSIDQVMGIDLNSGKIARSKARKVRSLCLEEEFLDRVHGQVGQRYKEVVRRCISGGLDLGVKDDSDESDPNVGAAMLQVFSQDVVSSLGSIQV